MMMLQSPLLIKTALFALAILPALIVNLKTGQAKNRDNAILFVAGVLVAIFGSYVGLDPLKLSTVIGWFGLAVLMLAAAAFGVVSGGVAKFMIALLPWFALGDYVALIIVGGFLTAGIAALKSGKTAPVIAPMAASGIAIWGASSIGYSLF
jgi:hypothetical protein